jgi:hypothetical protein
MLVAMLAFVGMSALTVIIAHRVNPAASEVWHLPAYFAAAALAGQVTRRVLPVLALTTVAIAAFVGLCVSFGLQAKLGFLSDYQVPLAIAVALGGALVGASLGKPGRKPAAVWLVLALVAIEFGIFDLLAGITTLFVYVPPGLFLMVGIFAGAALFVMLVSDLEHWQLGAAAGAIALTATFAIRTEPVDERVIGPITASVFLGIAGGMLGRKLRRTLKRAEIPPAQVRK